MTAKNDETKLTLTGEQIVTRRRALGLAAVAAGATALVGRAAWADSDALSEETISEEESESPDTDAADVMGDSEGDDMSSDTDMSESAGDVSVESSEEMSEGDSDGS